MQIETPCGQITLGDRYYHEDFERAVKYYYEKELEETIGPELKAGKISYVCNGFNFMEGNIFYPASMRHYFKESGDLHVGSDLLVELDKPKVVVKACEACVSKNLQSCREHLIKFIVSLQVDKYPHLHR
jgi:hypothetical protein